MGKEGLLAAVATPPGGSLPDHPETQTGLVSKINYFHGFRGFGGPTLCEKRGDTLRQNGEREESCKSQSMGSGRSLIFEHPPSPRWR